MTRDASQDLVRCGADTWLHIEGEQAARYYLCECPANHEGAHICRELMWPKEEPSDDA